MAVNFGTDLTVTTGAGADVSAKRYGVFARNYGTGATSVTVNGDVTASGTTGLDSAILARGAAAVTVVTGAGTTVSGQENGILARTSGASAITITVDGDVSGAIDDGVYARSDGGGVITITVGSTGSVNSSGLQADDFAIQTTGFGASGPAILTVGGAVTGGVGGAVQLWSLDDRFELHPTAAVVGTVFAGAGTDTFVLGGAGTGSFDVSTIGPGQQYRDFELFLKEDASHWTLTGTNAGIPAFAVDGGLLSVSGALGSTAFTVNGATLELLGTGAVGSVDIASAAGVFDISGTTAGATIATLSGVAGSSVNLGNQTLTLSNASGAFAGVISGTGGLTLGGGIETLTGINTYSGATIINGGTLALAGTGSIAASNGVNIAGATGVLDISGTAAGATISTLAGVAGSSVVLGSQTLTLSNASGTFAGVISGTGGLALGGGIETLTGINTYSGATIINGGTLALAGTGSIAASNGVNIAGATGVFDISGTTSGATISALSGVGGSSIDLGNQTLTLSNASGAFAGAISGTGGLTLGGGIETLTGINTYSGPTSINGGTLLVNGSIASSAVTVNSGGTLSGTGTVGPLTVASGGTLSPGDPTGTLTVGGNLALAAGSVLRMEVNGPLPGDGISVNGTVNVTGSNLQLFVGPAQVTPVTQYLLIDNDGVDPVVGTFASATNNLPFLELFVLYGYNGDTGDLTGGNDVGVRLLRNDIDYCYVTVTANQCSVTGAFAGVPIDDPLLFTVVTQTVDGARQAFDALSGEIHATTRGILLDDSRYVREATLGRLLQADYAGGAGPAMALGYAGDPVLAAPADDAGPAFWVNAYGARGTVESDMNAAEAKRDVGGFILGADGQVWGDWRLGLAGGYAHSDILVDDRNSTAGVESFHLAAYAGGPLGPLALRLGSAATWNGIDTTRDVVYPGFTEQETASHIAATGQIFGEAGLPVDIGPFAVEPFVGLTRVVLSTDDATEQGGIAALLVPGNDAGLTYATLGLRAMTATHGFDMDLKPHAALVWQHAFGELIPHIDPGFISTGTTFSSGIDGAPIARDSLLLEAGIDWDLRPWAALGLTYSGKFAQGTADSALYARFTGRF